MKKLFVFVFFLFFRINAGEQKESLQFDTWISVQGPIEKVTLFVDGYTKEGISRQFPIEVQCSEKTPESQVFAEDLMQIELQSTLFKKLILSSCLIKIADVFKSQVPQPEPVSCNFEFNEKQGIRVSTGNPLVEITLKDGKPDKTKTVFDLLFFVRPFKIRSEDNN